MASTPAPKRSFPDRAFPNRAFPAFPAGSAPEATRRSIAGILASGFFFAVFGIVITAKPDM